MSSHLTGTSSGRKTADAVICARPARLLSVILEGDGTNACSVVLYDNATTNSGTVLAEVLLPASGIKYQQFMLPCGVEASFGIFADVTGTGAAYVVHTSQL